MITIYCTCILLLIIVYVNIYTDAHLHQVRRTTDLFSHITFLNNSFSTLESLRRAGSFIFSLAVLCFYPSGERVPGCRWVSFAVSALSTLVCCCNLPFSPLKSTPPKSLFVLHYKYHSNVSRKIHKFMLFHF